MQLVSRNTSLSWTVMQKSWKIGLLLVLMFLTAIPTFLFLASVLFLIALFFRVFGPVYGVHIIPEGYYLFSLSVLCTIIFFASLVTFIRTRKPYTYAPASVIYCWKCGARNVSGANYCIKCGEKLLRKESWLNTNEGTNALSFKWAAVVFLILLFGGLVITYALQYSWVVWIVLVSIGFIVYVIVDNYRTRERKPLTSQETQPVKEVVREREVIKDVVKIPCSYCGTLIPVEAFKCPNCGAPLRRWFLLKLLMQVEMKSWYNACLNIEMIQWVVVNERNTRKNTSLMWPGNHTLFMKKHMRFK